MKKIIISIAVLLAVAAVICMIAVVYQNRLKTPFADLTPDEVDYITVEYGIPGYQLTDEEKIQLVGLLNDIVIYGKDNSQKTYMGDSIDLKIAYKDGESVDVSLFTPFVFINGERYNCEYGPCIDAGNYIHDIYLYQFYGKRE